MSEARNDQDKFVSAIAIAGASVPIVEGIVALSNGGVIGGIVGLGVSGLVWLAADEMAKKGRGLTLPASSLPRQRAARSGQPGVFARLLTGKDDRDEQPQPKDGRDDPQTDKLPEENSEGIFPQYAERDTLRLGRVLATGQRFDPHFNSLVGQGMIMAAVQGAGKSQLTGRTIEQAGKCGMPLMALDHKGEYDTITELPYVNGYRAGATTEFDFQLTAENARELVEKMMVNRYQVMVNLPSYGTSWLARAEVVAAIGKALMEYAAEQKQRRMKLLPCLVLLDEAQLYIPQDVSLLPPEAQENRKVLADLKNSFFALVSNGRSFGYTMCFATQSLTYIAKWAIKSCQIQVFLRHAEKNALDMCEDIIDASVATREEIRTFDPGVGVVIGFTRDPMVVKFDKKESRDESETPTIERLREPVQRVSAMPVAKLTVPQSQQKTTFTLEEALRLVQEHPEIDPLWFMSRIAEYRETDTLPEQETVPVMRSPYYPQSGSLRVDQVSTMVQPVATYRQPVVHQDKDQAKIEKGLRLWNEGHNSVRKLEAASGWSNGETRRIIKLMEDRGLISRER